MRSLLFLLLLLLPKLHADDLARQPFAGVTLTRRTIASPRATTVWVAQIRLDAPGLSFRLTPPGTGKRETVRQTTLDFLNEQRAQLAVNAHFFLPWPADEPDSDLIGLAASEGRAYSAFESPEQSYAIVDRAPAIDLGRDNRARLVRFDPDRAPPDLWNTVSGSAQIVTGGVATVPEYRDAAHPLALLILGGPGGYSNAKSWYAIPNARTIAGLDRARATLVLCVIEKSSASGGLSLPEAADILIRDFEVHDALNLDGGGSSTMAIAGDGELGEARLLNTPSGGGRGRAVGSSLAIFSSRPSGAASSRAPRSVPSALRSPLPNGPNPGPTLE